MEIYGSKKLNILLVPKSVVGPANSFPNFSILVLSWSCKSRVALRIGDGGCGGYKKFSSFFMGNVDDVLLTSPLFRFDLP